MFVPLRVHSAFSKGKGGVLVGEAAAWAAGRGMPAAALADIGTLSGWGRWKRAALGRGVRPLFGCEVETAGGRLLLLVKGRERPLEGHPTLAHSTGLRAPYLLASV